MPGRKRRYWFEMYDNVTMKTLDRFHAVTDDPAKVAMERALPVARVMGLTPCKVVGSMVVCRWRLVVRWYDRPPAEVRFVEVDKV